MRLTSLEPFLLSGVTTIKPRAGVIAHSGRLTDTGTDALPLGGTTANWPLVIELAKALNGAKVGKRSWAALVRSNATTL